MSASTTTEQLAPHAVHVIDARALRDTRGHRARVALIGLCFGLSYLVGMVAAWSAMVAGVGLTFATMKLWEEELVVFLFALPVAALGGLMVGLCVGPVALWGGRHLLGVMAPDRPIPRRLGLDQLAALLLYYVGSYVGMLLFIVPGFVIAYLLQFAYPAMVVHGLSGREAITLSVKHFLRHPRWRLHLGSALGPKLWSTLMILALPLSFPVFFGFYLLRTLHGYSAWFGDGPVPRRLS